MKTADQIRQEFLDFFAERGHTIVPSASLLPEGDPTLLFTNAGMNQFKDVFLGIGARPYSRAADSQKVIRVSGKHNDLDEVGRDTYHHTFFEMLGNWSFGDYYKREAITWAWELLTERWGLPKEKLFATVHDTDHEAEALWPELTGIPAKQVLRFGDRENFWEMGETGPCGPCTEIHIDLGPQCCDRKDQPGHTCRVNGDCGRFVELWNLVFIEYERQPDRSLKELPSKHVDTGMGFERIVAVLQGKVSNYDTDLFIPIIDEISELTGAKKNDPEHQVAMRVIADHIRSLTFAIADGALPSNEGRGYVIRRILRRAARFAHKIGVKELILHRLVPTVISIMGKAYPEIEENRDHITRVILAEEEAFGRTLDKGVELFTDLTKTLRQKGGKIIPGAEAFKLYDTYGFPVDLTQLMAEELGMTVEEEEFNRLMEEQRKRARAVGKFSLAEKKGEWKTLLDLPHSRFIGYQYLQSQSKLCMVGEALDHYQLVFDITPFYAEGGGQVGDCGTIIAGDQEFKVVGVTRDQDRIVHLVTKETDFPFGLASYQLLVAVERRRMIAANHTATHLLQAALRKLLGEHLHQAGSLVAPERLRFDFTHYHRLTEEELERIEDEVNQYIACALPVWGEEIDYQTAVNRGALAFFGEKYGEKVRTIRIGEVSMELCGGTHVSNTAELLTFRLLSEGSVATGVRRIEATTGVTARRLAEADRLRLRQISTLLQTEPEITVDKVTELLDENNQLKKLREEWQRGRAKAEGDKALESLKEIKGNKFLVARLDDLSLELLRESVDRYKSKLQSCVVLLGGVAEGKVHFVAGVTPDLVRIIKAGAIVKKAAEVAGGGGGGRPEMAQAGGKTPGKIDQALAEGERFIREALS